MNFQTVIDNYQSKGKIREAWFVEKYYLEHKEPKQIISELYMNSKRIFYRTKNKVKSDIKKTFCEMQTESQ